MVSPANTYVGLTHSGPGIGCRRAGQVLPERQAELHPHRRRGRLPGCGGRAAHEAARLQERLHPQRQGGLRPRRRDDYQELRDQAGPQGRRLHGLGPEGVELRGAGDEDQAVGRGRCLPRRPHLRERREADQGPQRSVLGREVPADRSGRLQRLHAPTGPAAAGHVHQRRRRPAGEARAGTGKTLRQGLRRADRHAGRTRTPRTRRRRCRSCWTQSRSPTGRARA